jgi:hypothetical protein
MLRFSRARRRCSRRLSIQGKHFRHEEIGGVDYLRSTFCIRCRAVRPLAALAVLQKVSDDGVERRQSLTLLTEAIAVLITLDKRGVPSLALC